MHKIETKYQLELIDKTKMWFSEKTRKPDKLLESQTNWFREERGGEKEY